MLWEIVARHPPWDGVPAVAVLTKVTAGERPPIPTGCPEVLRYLIQRCWAQEPEARPAFPEVVARARAKAERRVFSTRPLAGSPTGCCTD